MNALVKQDQSRAMTLEQVLIGGDLGKLTSEQRVEYYNRVCESVGLNPLTQPFAYITLNNKLTLYALRACTDQLRAVHSVSVEEMTESERDGVFIVTAKVRNKDGRTDIAKGAVNISGIKGEALANALMKTETKAKRRATLSICGLGMLDETEVETIPNARPEAAPQRPTLIPPPAPKPGLSEADERRLDQESMRQMRGETTDSFDAETGEVIEPETSPSATDEVRQKAIAWAQKSIVAVKGFRASKDFNAWYTLEVRDAIKRLKDIDAKLQDDLVTAVSNALDRFNPIGA